MTRREGENIFLSGQIDHDGMLPALKRWFDEEHAKILAEWPMRPGRRSIMMACPIYGRKFIERFKTFCLPSMLSDRNRRALTGACRLIFFTDRAGFRELWHLARDLTNMGLPALCKRIPDEVMALKDDFPHNKYWILGVSQQIGLQSAQRHGLGFHMLQPDHVYCDGYFVNLFRLAETTHCIPQTTISGNIYGALPELEAYRQEDRSIKIGARELGALTFRHIHGQTKQTIMNGSNLETDLPDTHCMVWVGTGFARLHCCHLNASYLSPEIVSDAPVRLFNALDTMLPLYMFGKAHVPEIEDGMTFVELSDETKLGHVMQVSVNEMAFRFWNTVNFHEPYLPFFSAAHDVPIDPQEQGLPVEEIERRQRRIYDTISGSREAMEKVYDDLERQKVAA